MYRLRRGVRLRKGPKDSCWAFCLDSGEHFELNATAYYVLTEVERGTDAEQIARHLSQEYGLEASKASEDVHDLLKQAVEHGLVVEEG